MNLLKKFLFYVFLIHQGSAVATPFVPADQKLESEHPYSILLNRSGNDAIECSGTVVSPDGYILTALHCFATCLNPRSTNIEIELPSKRKQSFEQMEFDQSGSCAIVVPNTFGISIVPISIVAVGTTRMMDNNELMRIGIFNIEDAYYLKEIGYTAPAGKGDFAIIKIPVNKNKLKCAKIANGPPKPGEYVWNLSFPTFERDGIQSIKGKAYYTNGYITTGVLDSVRIKALHDNDPMRNFYPKYFNENEMFYGTLDGEGGSSGSGIFNEKNEIIGVYVSSLKPRNVYAEGTTRGISTYSIVKELESKLGKEKVNQIFNCP